VECGHWQAWADHRPLSLVIEKYLNHFGDKKPVGGAEATHCFGAITQQQIGDPE
jgi:hypothetical protein